MKARKRFNNFLTNCKTGHSMPQLDRVFKFNHAPEPVLVKTGTIVKGIGVTNQTIKIDGATFKIGSYNIIAQRVIVNEQQYQIQHPKRKDLAIWLKETEFSGYSITKTMGE